jgi:hypothetical protein
MALLGKDATLTCASAVVTGTTGAGQRVLPLRLGEGVMVEAATIHGVDLPFGMTGPERLMALLGDQPLREPTMVELLSWCLRPTGYAMFGRSTPEGNISMGRRLMCVGVRR